MECAAIRIIGDVCIQCESACISDLKRSQTQVVSGLKVSQTVGQAYIGTAELVAATGAREAQRMALIRPISTVICLVTFPYLGYTSII